MEEIWKDVEGYEGLYQVSNLGRIKSLPRWIEFSDGRVRFYQEKIKKDKKVSTGYRQVTLYRNCVNEYFYVHRLVAGAFIPNPNNLIDINHIDGNKTNNLVTNLEWCSRSENIKHAYDTGLRIAHTGDAIEKKSKAVLQFKEDGTFVAEYPSETEAAKKNMCKQSTISYYCRGNNKHKKMYMGYIWKYKNDVVCQD